MCSPRRNNPDGFAPPRENDKEGLAVHLSYRLTPFLSVIAPLVDALQAVRITKHPRRMAEIEAAFGEIAAAFPVVPLEYHMGGNAVQFSGFAKK